jgi:hypothetical protein
MYPRIKPLYTIELDVLDARDAQRAVEHREQDARALGGGDPAARG